MNIIIQNIEAILMAVLFLAYMGLWWIKRREMKKKTGIDPEVFSNATSPLQRFMGAMERVLTVYATAIIVLHAAGVQYYSLFSRFTLLDSRYIDYSGFALGIAGLSICRHAQTRMGYSWRVGIDENNPTPLVTGGIYRFIRNPTYLGLFLLAVGVWMIWPTWTMGLFSLSFIVFLEIQVRCEEEYLEKIHGNVYTRYLGSSWRYVPYVY